MRKARQLNRDKTLLLVVLLKLVLVIFLTNLFLENVRAGGVLEWMVVSFVFMFLSPFFVIKKIFKQDSKKYFLSFNWKIKELLGSLALLIVFVAIMGLFVIKLNWQDSLMVSSWVLAEDVKLMLFVDLLIVPIVLFAKEFFFRGFIMKRLMAVIGIFFAIFIQALLFLVYELGVGGMISWKSMILIIIPNIFLGIVAYRNKSIFISTVFHWIYLLALDIYFYYQFTS